MIFWSALEECGELYDEVITKSPLFVTKDRVSDMALLEPVTRAAVQAIMQESAVPLIAFETFRSQIRQTELFDAGATQLKQVGVHHYGLACDLVKDVNGQPSWEGDFSFLGELARKHNLVWGGSWKGFVDSVHVQRITVADQQKLFTGNWYPSEDYNAF